MKVSRMGSSPSTSALSRTWRNSKTVRLVWNVGIAVGGVILARLLGTLTQFVLPRQMSIDEFGVYTSLYTLLGVAIIFSSFGLDTWLLRQGGNPATLRDASSDALSLRLYATVPLIVLTAVALLVTNQPGVTPALLAMAGAGLLLELLLTTGQTALRAQVRNHAAALLQVFVAGLFIGLLVLFQSNTAPLLSATAYRLMAAILGIALLAWLMRGRMKLVWHVRRFWQVLLQARIFFISDILANIALKADLTLVSLMMGPAAAALYAPALTIINTTFIVPAVAAQVLLPIVSRPSLSQREARWILVGSIAGSVAYGLFWFGLLGWEAQWLVQLIFPPEFAQSAPLLQIMALIPLMKSLNFCWVTIMVARDKQAFRTKLQAVGSIVNALGNIAVIPVFGLIGAAWVNLGTEVVLLACYGLGAWLTLRRRP